MYLDINSMLSKKSFINTPYFFNCTPWLLFEGGNLRIGVIAGVVTLVALKLNDSGYGRFTLVVQTNCIRLMHKVDARLIQFS